VLVALNLIAYLLEIRHGGGFFSGPSDSTAVHYGAIPHELSHRAGQIASWKTALTSLFLHGSFLHLLGDVVFLAIFGPTVEDAVGHWRFCAFYLLGGLVALGAEVALAPGSTAPALAASGAVAAVLGGYLLLYPHARVLSLAFIVFFFTLVEVPAVLLLAFWFLEQLYVGLAGLASPLGGGEVAAYLAHVGGFAFGLLVIRLFAGPRRGAATPPLAVY
jgi:membrane associated rhomboid family serine protease